jgi:hypothetical protein
MKKVKLNPPMMPYLATIEGDEDTWIDIADFTKEEAEAYADMMREAFMNHWEERKKRKEAVKQATGEWY